MAITVNNGGGRSRRGGAPLAEINVTPFVDVALVLLIIFMLTAHVMDFGIEINVPKVRMVKETAKELPVVLVTKDGLTYLNEKPTKLSDLKEAIKTRFGSAKAVYVRADKDAIWDPIAQVVSTLGESGLGAYIVTQPADSAPKRR